MSSVADAFRLPDAPRLTARTLRKSALVVTELRGGPGHGLTNPIPADHAYLVGLQIAPCPGHELFFEGRHVPPRNFRANVTTIFDLRRDPMAELRDPFHSLMFYLPHSLLNDAAAEEGAGPVDELRYPLGEGIDDPTITRLISSLRPAIDNPQEASSVFVDYVASTLCHHIARTYGGVKPVAKRGGLSPWQERRVVEMLEANLAHDMPLSRLAAECGMSVRHFGRAFRQSTGFPPHRWILEHRVERAKELLRDPAQTLLGIALACGFADQSHFTRVFARVAGVSPGAWRVALR